MAEVDLYDRPDCPYSKRVRRVLDVLSVDYEETIVPEDKDDRNELDRLTGQRGVPAIITNDHPNGLADSSEIADYLKANYE
ncbi:MAG: glutaredoxin related protein [Halonotius sp. J07HN6]|jgi:Glutaredoxin and related proteins|nr:MAG: glutaredoxin related protein [Halonotius sp. J07HN6]ESS09851.1 MAG: glutaredoxin related protein [uncultured archaeon A07HN63]